METRIRPYREEDIEAMIDLFLEAVPLLPNYHRNITVHPDRMRYVLRSSLDNDTFMAVLLVTEQDEIVGGIAAQCVPIFYSFDTVAFDNFLYIRESYRSLRDARRLIMAYIEWAKAKGASLIRASHTSGYDVAPLLKYVGFQEVGKIYDWHNPVVRHNRRAA